MRIFTGTTLSIPSVTLVCVCTWTQPLFLGRKLLQYRLTSATLRVVDTLRDVDTLLVVTLPNAP